MTYDKPLHAAKNDCVFGSNCLFSNVFFRIFGSHGSSGSHISSSSVLESLLELTDATVMMNNEPTDTLHRIGSHFQSVWVRPEECRKIGFWSFAVNENSVPETSLVNDIPSHQACFQGL